MSLIPSNLGQIVGRLMYRAQAEPGAEPPAVGEKPAPVVLAAGHRQEQVLELVRQRITVSCADLTAALGITVGNAAVMLLTMWRSGKLARSGTPGRYRYMLPSGTGRSVGR